MAWILGAALLAACPPRVPAPSLEPPAHPEPDVVGTTHIVKAGETLWRIARTYGVPPEEIAIANLLPDGAKLSPGQSLFVPGEPVDPGAPPSPAPAGIGPADGKVRLAWPLVGVLYARFGRRGETWHDGVDIAAPEGTVVRSAADGEVIFSGDQKGYGHLVIVRHEDGLLTLYAHNQENLAREGARVKAGDPVSRVGQSGRTSGPHLHFEVRRGTRPEDPLRHLPPPR